MKIVDKIIFHFWGMVKISMPLTFFMNGGRICDNPVKKLIGLSSRFSLMPLSKLKIISKDGINSSRIILQRNKLKKKWLPILMA